MNNNFYKLYFYLGFLIKNQLKVSQLLFQDDYFSEQGSKRDRASIEQQLSNLQLFQVVQQLVTEHYLSYRHDLLLDGTDVQSDLDSSRHVWQCTFARKG